MLFSQHWLYSRVNPGLSSEELARLLTMAGLEVEEYAPAAAPFSGVVVAHVLSVEKHPDADRLNITRVDTGQGEPVQIVCGAPNVKAGIRVPCALPGAMLPGDFKIKPTKMRGQVSDGMLCSAKELGISEESGGLFVLPDDAPVGEDIRTYLDLDDTVFTLKITPNRADCLSIRGLAREVGALTGHPYAAENIPAPTSSITDTVAIHNHEPQSCGSFLSRVVRDIDSSAPTPLWMKQRLERCGIRSISAPVDIGNYVMLELGQPMHFFDASKISGSLNVRKAENGEQLECLNGQTVTLAHNTLVVADDEKALSIAGLMGGNASAVSPETRDIVIECAWFALGSIAGKSRQYGFGSDSSFRYERGVDPALRFEAVERATSLLLDICGGRAGPVTEARGELPEQHQITLRTDRVKKILGIAVEPERIHTILQQLGLNPLPADEGFTVTAPGFRFDLKLEIDLIEEIGRVFGYENIPDHTPEGRLLMLPLPESRRPRFAVYRRLADRGYREVISYAFVDTASEMDFSGNDAPVRLQNPIAEHMAVMRSTLFGGLIKTLQTNCNRKQERVRIFEAARVFSRMADGSFVQKEKLGGLAFGSVYPEQWGITAEPVGFYDVKADIEALTGHHCLPWHALTDHPALHPGRAAAIRLAGKNVGVVGELHPQWCKKYGLSAAPILFEADFDLFLQQEKICYRPVSKYQPVRRDLAFVVDENTEAQTLIDALHAVDDTRIRSVSVFDVYRGKGLEAGKKSLAVKIIIRDQNATLTDDDTEAMVNRLLEAAAATGAVLRG